MEFGMIYSDKPPYDILQNNHFSFALIQKMKRFARFWDLVYNSGNFRGTVEYIFEDDVFAGFFNFSEWIYGRSESTWQISLNRLSEYIFEYLTEYKEYDKKEIAESILKDIIKVQGRKIPGFLRLYIEKIPDLRQSGLTKHNKRQILRSNQ
jgi:hypothetical protein